MTWLDVLWCLVTDIPLPRNTEVDPFGVRGIQALCSLLPQSELAYTKKDRVRSVPACSDLQCGQNGAEGRVEGIASILSAGKQVLVQVY